MRTYVGGILSPDLEGGRAGATLTVSGGRVVAVSRDGRTFDVELGSCTIELGGASGRMWFCRAKDRQTTVYSEADGFHRELLEQPSARDSVQRLVDGVKRKRRMTAALSVILLALAVLAVGGGYLGLRSAGRAAVLALPISADQKIGQVAAATMDLGGPTVRVATLVDGIEEIVARLDEHDGADFSYHVRVVDAPVTNAFALPGGELVVFTGLIRSADSAQQVAAVLAHEIGHVVHRHGLQRIAQSVGLVAAVQLLVGDVGGLAAMGTELLQQGALMSYGRDDERQADAFGVRLLHRAGFSPIAMSEFFATLAADSEEMPEALAWLSTHPDLEERVATTAHLAEQWPVSAPQPLQSSFTEMKAALTVSTTQVAEAVGADSGNVDQEEIEDAD